MAPAQGNHNRCTEQPELSGHSAKLIAALMVKRSEIEGRTRRERAMRCPTFCAYLAPIALEIGSQGNHIDYDDNSIRVFYKGVSNTAMFYQAALKRGTRFIDHTYPRRGGRATASVTREPREGLVEASNGWKAPRAGAREER